MIRKLTLMAGMVLAVSAAYGAEAGKIIFSAGAADIAGKAAAVGGSVNEGELLHTGADGYIYIKTIDNGLFILRPNTQARIATYHVDTANPANTQVKLELISGVARSRSGDAVKLARQNFRFNTPVAAIGVRGTDFAVSTDQDTSRVTVISGAITVSGFAGACRPEGGGPCEGNTARELSASQKGVMLQVQRGQAAPQLLQNNNTLAPDVVAPPRSDEPGHSGGTASNGQPNLDAQKTEALQSVALQNQKPTQPVEVVTPPAEVLPPVTDTQQAAAKVVSWGRWAPALNRAATSELSKDGAERIAANNYYVLFRSNDGANFVTPQTGSVGFSLASSEAVVFNRSTQIESAAQLSNGQLNFNFDQATFATQFDLLTGKSETFKMANSGTVNSDGVFSATNKNMSGANIGLTGVLNSLTGATYIFQGSLDNSRVVSGVTSWKK